MRPLMSRRLPWSFRLGRVGEGVGVVGVALSVAPEDVGADTITVLVEVLVRSGWSAAT